MQNDLKQYIHDKPDFPKPGILFKDISPLLKNPGSMKNVIHAIASEWHDKIDSIAGLDARGFIFASQLASYMNLPFVMMRKKGKLPGENLSVSYDLEYGSACLEVQSDAFEPGERVLVVDDLLATGGTAAAACSLIEKAGAVVAGCSFVIELSNLNGREKLANHPIHSILTY